MRIRDFVLGCAMAMHSATGTAIVLAPEGTQLHVERVPSPAEARYNAGLEALARGDLQAAMKEFNASRKLDDNWTAPLLGLADVALKQHDSDTAEKLLRQARSMAPDDPTVQTAWGRFCTAAGRYQEAEAALIRATKLAPRAIAPRLDLGALYSNALRKPADAVAAFEDAVRINPEHAGARHGLGMALIAADQIDRGIEELKNAAKLAPDNPLPRHALGRVYASQGQLGRALDAYGDALRVQPNFSPSRIDRGNILLAQGRWHDAKQDFTQAVTALPGNAGAQLGLGIASQELGEFEAAREAYLAAIKANPDLAVAYNNLAWLEVKQQQLSDRALPWARKAVQLAPQVADFHDTLGWILHLRGDNGEAKKSLEAAAEIQSTPHILYHLGSVYAALGERSNARDALRRALATDPDFSDAKPAKELLQGLK